MNEIFTSLHSAVYSALLKLWSMIYFSEGWLRSLSALFSLISIFVFYHLCRRISGEKQALVAAFLLGTSPYLIGYSQQVRFYTLFVFGSCISLWYAVQFLKFRKKSDFLKLLIWHGILMCVHGLSGLMLLSELTAFFLTSKKVRRSQKITMLILSAAMILALLYSNKLKEMGFNLFAMYTNAVPGYHPGRQISLASFIKFPLTFYVFSLGEAAYPFSVLSVSSVCLFSGMFISGLLRLKKETDLFIFIVTLLIVPAVMLYLLFDVLCPPTYASASPRYLIFLLPLFYFVLAAGVPERFWGRIVVSAAILINLVCLNSYWSRQWSYSDDLVNWRKVSEWIKGEAKGDATVFLDGRSREAAEYYFPASWKRLREETLTEDLKIELPERLFLTSAHFNSENRTEATRAVRFLEKTHQETAVYNHYPLFVYFYKEKKSEEIKFLTEKRTLSIPVEIYGLEFQDLKLPLLLNSGDQKAESLGSFGLPGLLGEKSQIVPVVSQAPVRKITVFSNVVSARKYPENFEIARIKVMNGDGEIQMFSMRKGSETGFWDQDCEESSCQEAFSWHKRIAFVGSQKYPGSWRDFQARIFYADFHLKNPERIVSVEIESLIPEGRIYVWGITYG